MARGELTKKLLSSYGRDEEFRVVAEQIIAEEEKKNNRALARSLRKTLESLRSRPQANGLSPLAPFPDDAGDFIQSIEPVRTPDDIMLSRENIELFSGLLKRVFASRKPSKDMGCRFAPSFCSADLPERARRFALRSLPGNSACRCPALSSIP